jgi:hypothetical protein
MKNIFNILILLSFMAFGTVSSPAHAEKKSSFWGWSWTKRYHDYREQKYFNPLLENSRHVQVPQWEHKDWYAEDWLAQEEGIDLVRGFYAANIFQDQFTKENEVPTLVVGPNFYRLSGYDKRRVTHIVDIVYGITASKEDGSFILQDWHTKMPIGNFDRNGLRLY